MRKLCLALLLLIGTAWNVLVNIQPAEAIDPFWKQFQARYIKAEPKTDEEKAFSEAASDKNMETGKCWICHVKGKNASKKLRNNYGQELAKLLDRKKFTAGRLKRDKEAAEKEIQEAFDKVAKMHVDPEDDKSELYGDRIAAGKVPGDQKVAGGEPGAEDAPSEDEPAAKE